MAHKWRVLIVVSAAVFMASLDLFIVNIAFPAIERDFGGTSLGTLSWILNAYAIVFAALLVPAGRTADRLGRKRAFLIGLAVFPTSLALLLPEFPPHERRTAVAVWAAVGAVAAAAGPPVGGLLVQVGWQLVFLVNVPIGIVLLFAAARILRET